MPRTCFVIMPFSTTQSCTEQEWTEIFNVLKRSVEDAGLDYDCRRSVATRGNIIGGIIRDVNDAYVVLADLTDRNANVFYELGVRQALKNRTIILAQRREDIPFDLQAYASHVYGWKTTQERDALASQLKVLLDEIDSNPDRSDNPVSDFLRVAPVPSDATPDNLDPAESTHAQPLLGQGAKGLDPTSFARRLASQGTDRSARVVYRLTRSALTPLMNVELDELNSREIPSSVASTQAEELASSFISAIEPLSRPIEQFALAAVEEGWRAGVAVGHRLAGDLISFSSRNRPGRSIRFAQGSPGLLAWRLLVLLGAKATVDEELDILQSVLLDPIEAEESSGRYSNRSLTQRRDLFWPEAYLGNANLGINYLISLWRNQLHLRTFFISEEEYHFALAQFLMLVALAYSKFEEERQLYPGYRNVPQARRAMDALCSRLAANNEYRDSIAKVIGQESGLALQQNWTTLVSRANAAQLGREHFPNDGVHFPDPMNGPVRDW